MYIELSGAFAFLLLLFRMTGMLTFNPIFSRSNVPVMLRMGLAFLSSILLYNTVGMAPVPQDPTLLQLLYYAVFELSIGLMAGMVFRLFLSVLVVGGEVIDTQLGISMSKMFDPGTNTSVSITTNFLNAMFYLLFFLTEGHHTFLRMAGVTFYILPLGTTTLNSNAFYYIAELFSIAMTLALKLALPVIVIEVIVTMAVGIIMRVVPQINIFVVNIQFKLMVGIIVMFLLVPSFAGFIESLITMCFEQVAEVLLLSR